MADIPSISVDELASRLVQNPSTVLIDVRQPEEHAEVAIPGSILIPLGEVADRLHEIPQQGDVLVHCKLGGRSAKAVAFLQSRGVQGATNVEGGIEAWLQRES